MAADESWDSADPFLREACDTSEPSNAEVAALGLRPGQEIGGRFIIERRAGSGGMGAIYRAVDQLTKETVAIKVMASYGDSAARRFEQEALVLRKVSHPAIVRYVDQGTTPLGTRFFAMEWLEGEDLSQRLARSRLTIEESLALVRRACEGIAAAHERGILHRDIKPSNLFLVDRDASSVKVLDFGIARLREDVRPLTRSDGLLGTVGYMSPEQAMGPRDVDTRADVFALGCLLYECLTGRPAFVGANAVAVLAKVLYGQPPRVSTLEPGVNEALDTLVASMLSKDVAKRPRDAAAILSLLARCDDRPAAVVDTGPSPNSAAPASTAQKGPPRAMAAVALAMLTLAVIAFERSSEPPVAKTGAGESPLPIGGKHVQSREPPAATTETRHGSLVARDSARSREIAPAPGNGMAVEEAPHEASATTPSNPPPRAPRVPSQMRTPASVARAPSSLPPSADVAPNGSGAAPHPHVPVRGLIQEIPF